MDSHEITNRQFRRLVEETGYEAEGRDQDAERVLRGGNWDSPNAVFIRLKDRRGEDPDSSSNQIGFRCAKSVG